MERKGFSLVEVFIGIVILAIALLALAAGFAASTKRLADATDQLLARSARRSGEVLYPFVDRQDQPLALGWNHEQFPSTVEGMSVCIFTFHREGDWLDTMVSMAFKGEYQYRIEWLDDYTPVNRDVVVSWLGFVHTVENDALSGIQDVERAYPFVVIPYEKSRLLDVHRMAHVQEVNPKR